MQTGLISLARRLNICRRLEAPRLWHIEEPLHHSAHKRDLGSGPLRGTGISFPYPEYIAEVLMVPESLTPVRTAYDIGQAATLIKVVPLAMLSSRPNQEKRPKE
jgi:hypothetical protein